MATAQGFLDRRFPAHSKKLVSGQRHSEEPILLAQNSRL